MKKIAVKAIVLAALCGALAYASNVVIKPMDTCCGNKGGCKPCPNGTCSSTNGIPQCNNTN